MSDLIDRQVAIDALDKSFPVDPMRNDYTQGIACGAALATVYIKQLPSAQPKHGKWVERQHFYNDEETIDEWQIEGCSECGRYLTTPYRYHFFHHNFCPYCGARMEASDD